MKQYTLQKKERIKNRDLSRALFEKGNSFFIYPFRVFYLWTSFEDNVPCKVLTGASKRNVRKAIDRNRIKRQMREAYRQHKTILYDALLKGDRKMLLGLLFIGSKDQKYELIRDKIILILHRLSELNEKPSE